MSILYQQKTQWEWESWLISDKLLFVNYPGNLVIFVFKKKEEKSYKSSNQSLTALSEFDRDAAATKDASESELKKLVILIFSDKGKIDYKSWAAAWK
jgi:hypothetical protein